MELQYFSKKTFPLSHGNVGKLRISFNATGTIRLSKMAVEHLGIKQTSKVTIAQDKKHKENWYIFIDPENGFDVKQPKRKNDCRFYHLKLTQQFKDCFGFDHAKTIACMISKAHVTVPGSKTKYWPILVNATAVSAA